MPQFSTVWTLNKIPLVLPTNGEPIEINSPLGTDAGRAVVYGIESDLTKMELDKPGLKTLTLSIKNEPGGTQTHNWKLYLDKAFRATHNTSRASKGLSLYEIHLIDPRAILREFTSISAGYNVRASSTSRSDEWLTETLRDGSEQWTWREMIEDLWKEKTKPLTFKLSMPGNWVPVTKAGDFLFTAESLMGCMDRILPAIGGGLRYDHAEGEFSIVELGDDQPGLDDDLDDYEASAMSGATRVPEKFIISFPIVWQHRGTEPDVALEENARLKAYYELEVNSDDPAAVKGTRMPLFATERAIADIEGEITNKFDLSPVAANLAARWRAKSTEREQTERIGYQAGWIPGPKVDSVAVSSSLEGGTKTLITWSPALKPPIQDRTPIIYREDSLVYPDRAQTVKVSGSGGKVKQSQGFYPAKLERQEYDQGVITEGRDVWLKLIDSAVNSKTELSPGDRFVGKLNGFAKNKPVYQARLGAGTFEGGGGGNDVYAIATFEMIGNDGTDYRVPLNTLHVAQWENRDDGKTNSFETSDLPSVDPLDKTLIKFENVLGWVCVLSYSVRSPGLAGFSGTFQTQQVQAALIEPNTGSVTQNSIQGITALKLGSADQQEQIPYQLQGSVIHVCNDDELRIEFDNTFASILATDVWIQARIALFSLPFSV